MSRKKLLVTSLTVMGAVLLIPALAFGQDEAAMAHDLLIRQTGADAWKAIAAALSIGVAAFGGALGQGKAAAAALEGIARNPGASDRLFTPMILGLALIESLVIYALLISFSLTGSMTPVAGG